ncbi:MAG: YbbR-like domain-containing protein [Eubacterium sp.]
MNGKSSEKKVKKSNFSLRKLIYNDKYLIIFSIVSAIIVWIIASMSLSPETTKTITVPVNVDFSNSAAAQLGIKCYGDESIDVDVTISCKKYMAKDITAEDLKVSLQTNTVTTKGNIEVPIKVETGENADFTIRSYYPTVYKAYFDVEDQKVMDININYDDEDFVAEGYVMGEPLLSVANATVTGPKTYVSQVKQLVANVSFAEEELSSTKSVDLKLTPVDSNGLAVDYVTVNTGGESPTLTVPVLKEMYLDVAVAFTNKPEGVDTSKFAVSYSVEKVNAAVLEDAGIKEANIGNIDFSKLKTGRNTFTFDVSTLESMVILDNIKEITVTVNVPSNYKQKNIQIDKSMITVANVPDGYNVSVTGVNTSAMTVIGSSAELSADDVNVGLIVDLSAYENSIQEGAFEYAVTTTIENKKTCWVYGDYTATISVTKK